MSALNVSAILNAIRIAEERAIEQVAAAVVAGAKHRAPVRKVFKEKAGFRRRFRPLTPLERNIATRRAQTYYTHVQPNEFKKRRALAHIRNYATAQVPRRGSANSLANSRKLRVLGYLRHGQFSSSTGATRNRRGGFEPGAITPLLTARGRYEVRSGRAIHKEVLASGAIRIQVGGALKASIESEGVTHSDKGVTARVTAGIRYAKYVEFPTVHNAAQPFLRPALQGNRQRLRSTVATEVRKAIGG